MSRTAHALAIVLGAWLWSGLARAAEAEAPDAWLADFEERAARGAVKMEGAYVARLVVAAAKGADAAPVVRDVDGAKLARQSFLRAVSAAAWREAARYNRRLAQSGDPRAVLGIAGADLLLTPEGETGLRVLDGTGKVQTLASRAPESLAPADLAAYLRETLGYDAIVLEQRDDLILARTPDLRDGRKPQALALKDSAAKYVVAKGAAEGAGIFELVAAGDGVSVFKRIIGDEALPFGTKLALQTEDAAAEAKGAGDANAAESRAVAISLRTPAPLDTHVAITLASKAASGGASPAKACKSLVKTLTTGGGPWGLAPFRTASCAADGKLTAGKEKATRWRLNVTKAKAALELALAYGEPPVTVASATLPAKTVKRPFATPAKTRAAVAELLKELPFVARIERKQMKDKSLRIKLPKADDEARPPPPPTLAVYRLGFVAEAGAFRGEEVGELRSACDDAACTWTPDAGAVAALADGPVYLGVRDDKSFAADLRDRLLAAFSLGYVGMRAGREIKASSALFPPAQLRGLLVEMRGPPFQGLRVYYDEVPRIDGEFEGEAIHLGWSRLLLGYGFGYDWAATGLRFEVTPKLGVWNLDAALPRNKPDGSAEVAPFAIHRGFSGGAELDIERPLPWLLVRGWAARDFSTRFGTSVDSQRFGVDGVIKGPRLSRAFSLSFIAFGMVESFETKTKTEEDDGDGAASVGIDTSYAGLGLALSW